MSLANERPERFNRVTITTATQVFTDYSHGSPPVNHWASPCYLLNHLNYISTSTSASTTTGRIRGCQCLALGPFTGNPTYTQAAGVKVHRRFFAWHLISPLCRWSPRLYSAASAGQWSIPPYASRPHGQPMQVHHERFICSHVISSVKRMQHTSCPASKLAQQQVVELSYSRSDWHL